MTRHEFNTPAPQRPSGINLHLDAFRPWLSGDQVERFLPAIAARGFDHVRMVGDPVVVADDGRSVSDPQGLLERLVEQSRALGLTILPLSWSVIPDAVATKYPLVDAQGCTYSRGHWGLFNFSHPELREISIRALESTMRELQRYPDVFPVFQPTLEWQLVSFPPHGWAWESYAGESRRAVPTQVMYDVDSLARWGQFLTELPDPWRSAVEAEFPGTELQEVPPPDLDAPAAFTAHRLAWARFRSRLPGEYFAEIYSRLKPQAGEMRLLIPEAMPLPLIDSGLRLSSLGHNPEQWLAAGEIGDMLTVSVYDSIFEIAAYPGHADAALDHTAALMYFAELARAHKLPWAVTEQGGNSYHHTEDGQRYVVMRGALAAASFNIHSHSHLLWNDEPTFEGVHEQFYGFTRHQHQQSKPVAHEIARVRWLIEHADTTSLRPDPQVMVVIPRDSMDVGLEGWTTDALTDPWMQVSGVTTTSLIASHGLPQSTRIVVFSGRHEVGNVAMLDQVRDVGATAVLYAGSARYGVDDADERERRFTGSSGLRHRPLETSFGTVEIEWFDTAGKPTEVVSATLPAGLELRTGNLPDTAHIISAVRGSDLVLAYRYQDAIWTALPVGRPGDEIDSDLTAWTRELMHRSMPKGIKQRFEVLEGGDLTYHVIGDVLTVINSRPTPATARVSFDDGAAVASIDVAPGQFSAVQLSARPTVAVLAGAGQIEVDGVVVLESDAHAVAMLADNEVRFEPLHDREGRRYTAVTVNNASAVLRSEHGSDVWVRQGVGSSARVETTTEPAIQSKARFRCTMHVLPTPQRMLETGRAAYLTARPVEDRASRHTLLAAPDRAWIEWDVPDDGADIRCEYTWWAADGTASATVTLKLSGAARRVEVAVPPSYPALARCVLVTPNTADNGVRLVYEADDVLDVLTADAGDGITRGRLLHPMRREGYDVIEASAVILAEQPQRAAHLVIGHRACTRVTCSGARTGSTSGPDTTNSQWAR